MLENDEQVLEAYAVILQYSPLDADILEDSYYTLVMNHIPLHLFAI